MLHIRETDGLGNWQSDGPFLSDPDFRGASSSKGKRGLNWKVSRASESVFLYLRSLFLKVVDYNWKEGHCFLKRRYKSHHLIEHPNTNTCITIIKANLFLRI